MHSFDFLRDLAVVMLTAGATSVIFQRLRQPALLGYILAGILIGPHVPGPGVADERTIGEIAELGVVLLMFTLGLEFSIGKLRRVGGRVLLVAVGEVGMMLAIGYVLGLAFDLPRIDALFLGAAVSLSSTMIATSVLSEQGLRHSSFARMVVALLVAEDVLAVLLLTVLSAIAISGSVGDVHLLPVLGKMSLFVLVSVVVGLLLLPRLTDYIAGFQRDETLLVALLGICFGASLLAIWLGFSEALGAFLAGAVVAEARCAPRAVHLVEPLKDMFAALFFVAIGLQIDPAVLLEYALPAALIALLVILGKSTLVSAGAFFSGRGPRESLRVGISMAAIGEFSFVIATLGFSLGAISASVYPVIVAVSVICMAVMPQLLRVSNPLANGMRRLVPGSWQALAKDYTEWLNYLRPVSDNAVIAAMFRRLLWHIGINVALVVTLFLIAAFVNAKGWGWFSGLGIDRTMRHSIIWAAALFLSLPMLVAVYRKTEALGMLLAELGISERLGGRYTHAVRTVLARLIPLGALILLGILVTALTSTILPPREVAVILLVVGIVLALLLWRGLVKLHARFQMVIKETLEPFEPQPPEGSDSERPSAGT